MSLGVGYGAPIIENYIVDTGDLGAGNDKWTSTTVQTYTVPARKVWMLYGGHVKRDTQTGTATLLVQVFNAANELLLQLDTQTNAATTTSYPNTTSTAGFRFPMKLKAAWYVKITIGEAQGAAASASCIVDEISV